MKKIFLAVFALVLLAAIVSCEKTNYKHPAYKKGAASLDLPPNKLSVSFYNKHS